MLQNIYLQSNSSLSELNFQEAVGVVVGFTCSKHIPGACLYGFAKPKKASHWTFDYVIPPLVNTGITSFFLLGMATIYWEVAFNSSSRQKNVSLNGSVMKVVQLETSVENCYQWQSSSAYLLQIWQPTVSNNNSPVFCGGNLSCCAFLFGFGEAAEQKENITITDFNIGGEFADELNFAQLHDNAEPSSNHPDTD